MLFRSHRDGCSPEAVAGDGPVAGPGQPLAEDAGFVLPITAENFGEGPEKFAVVRIAVCCGPDDMPIGFACMGKDAPPENAWVRVTGVLQERDLNNGEPPYPYLDVQELEVLTKRGKQKVAM